MLLLPPIPFFLLLFWKLRLFHMFWWKVVMWWNYFRIIQPIHTLILFSFTYPLCFWLWRINYYRNLRWTSCHGWADGGTFFVFGAGDIFNLNPIIIPLFRLNITNSLINNCFFTRKWFHKVWWGYFLLVGSYYAWEAFLFVVFDFVVTYLMQHLLHNINHQYL